MMMEIVMPEGGQVNALSNGNVIETNQDGSAPAPFELFLASIGTCAGIYVARFCQQRGISTENIRIRQRMSADPASRLINGIELDIVLPEDFPEQYRDAVVRSAQLCAVKKHLEHPPEIQVKTSTFASV